MGAETQNLNLNNLKKCTSENTLDKVQQRNAKKRIIRNLIVLSFSYLCQFSASNALNNLQSSINSQDNLGIYTISLAAFSVTFSCLFLPSLLAKYAGFKWPLVLNEIFVIIFVLANFYPKFWTMLPASVLFGFSNSVLWTFQGSMISHLANEYAEYSKRKAENFLIRFFGFFYIIYQLSMFLINQKKEYFFLNMIFLN
jgi:MFS family permease